jgi:two-component system sensor histidine kinase ChvG
MASAIATVKPDVQLPERIRRLSLLPGSRLGRLIVVLNLAGLIILIVGALVLNELGRGLINAKIDSLTTQGEFIANVIEQTATRGDPQPTLDAERARDTLQYLFIPNSQRARVTDQTGAVIADSYVISDHIQGQPLPPVRKPGEFRMNWTLPWARQVTPASMAAANAELKDEVSRAMKGAQVAELRRSQSGDRVVSVSIPIQNVQAVLGVLTLESGDVDEIVTAQRWALLPFILIAIAVSLLSSILLSQFIAQPVLRLANAADRVTASRARAISLPDIGERDDELGDLARSLETMTSALSERMDAIEGFAADVAHEIRNPLTSIRSAVETLELVSDPVAKERLTNILKHDVGRLDRLITDISNASRLDAELSREAPRPLDLGRLLAEIVDLYEQSAKAGEPPVLFSQVESGEPCRVSGREGPLSQVFRNLIDNARSFSYSADRAPTAVRVAVAHQGRQVVVIVDDEGPGIPAENLETVFERFYTARPKGAAFGGHSGLGLSIARQIIEAHGGQIRAENRTDAAGAIAGARFTVALPEARA